VAMESASSGRSVSVLVVTFSFFGFRRFFSFLIEERF
jgi:hypothetical protein